MTATRSRATATIWAASIVSLMLAAAAFWQQRWLWTALFVTVAGAVHLLRLSLKKQIVYGLLTIVLVVTAVLAFVGGLDLYLHQRYARTGGYNVWGYRGPIVGAKKPAERRLVMLGGSVAFGYGVPADETIPAHLESFLRRARPQTPVSVVNLGWNSEGAYSFAFTLRDYEYLDYDAAILYSGYNDWLFNDQVFRHQSAVFRATGYLPIMRIVPLADWLRVRDLSKRGDQVVFKPNLADRSSTEAAEAALRVTAEFERQLGKLVPEPVPEAAIEAGACGDQWDYYCGTVKRAVDEAIERGKQVFVVTEPYATQATLGGPAGRATRGWRFHVEQQRVLANMLAVTYAHEPAVHYINMGPAVDLNDRELCYDGVHLTSKGNQQLAGRLAAAMLDVWKW